METTYRFCPWVRAVMWVCAIVGPTACAGAACLFVYVLYNYLVGSAAFTRRPYTVLFSLLLTGSYAVQLISVYRQGKRMVGYSVTVSDDSIRVDDKLARWDEIDRIEHLKRTIGIAFRVHLRDGRQMDVFSGLEDVSRIEELVLSRTAGWANGTT